MILNAKNLLVNPLLLISALIVGRKISLTTTDCIISEAKKMNLIDKEIYSGHNCQIFMGISGMYVTLPDH